MALPRNKCNGFHVVPKVSTDEQIQHSGSPFGSLSGALGNQMAPTRRKSEPSKNNKQFFNVALIINVALIFAVLSVISGTLTLPGIAGIVLTVGMAVDANVLVFERIREELKKAKNPRKAIELGYERAFSAIIDANITTLIAAVILLVFGSGPVKGFAITLGIGIVTSVFTAIWVTRLLISIWIERKRPKSIEI